MCESTKTSIEMKTSSNQTPSTQSDSSGGTMSKGSTENTLSGRTKSKKPHQSSSTGVASSTGIYNLTFQMLQHFLPVYKMQLALGL